MHHCFPRILATLSLISSLVPSLSRAEDWSPFEPIRNEPPPQVENAEWSGPIDAFVFARLAADSIEPAPSVDRRTWLRRVTYDLTGFPPTPLELRNFLDDARPDRAAMEHVVDRLLASTRYGERWGRHWLDVVRYADSDGFAIDKERLSHWRFRDYVIRSLNEDIPFDRFIREQLAGDELGAGDRGKIAVSFYRLGPWEADNMTKENRRQDYLNEVTDTVGGALLALTVGCAKCHDHKFDPILQADYYRLQAFFAPIKHSRISAEFQPDEITPALKRRREAAVAQRTRKITELKEKLRKKIAKAQSVAAEEIDDEKLEAAIKDVKEPLTKADVEPLKKLQTDAEVLAPEQRLDAMVDAIANPSDDAELPKTFVLENGDVFAPGDPVTPGFPSAAPVLSDLVERVEKIAAAPSGRRAVLADWITDPRNPITPRVLANRVWHYHFGRGIIATPNDFGENGAQPTHPRLLDYLAQRLMHWGWRLKPLHREIVLSRTYRTSSSHPQAAMAAEKDPDNDLLWRATPRRLEAETIRDAVLLVSGQLEDEMGGPGFYEQLPYGMGESYPFFKWKPSSLQQRSRRSVYMFQRRNLIHPMMETFDGADPNASCERRLPSVTAPQALTMFNGAFMNDAALRLAKRLSQSDAEPAAQIRTLFQLALARAPSNAEAEAVQTFWNDQFASYDEADALADKKPELDAKLRAFRDVCLAVLNTTEFIYLD